MVQKNDFARTAGEPLAEVTPGAIGWTLGDLAPGAERRLQVLQSLDSLGAGFQPGGGRR